MTTALRHEALVYESEDEFLDVLVPFLHDGLAAGSGVVVATNAANEKALVGALGTTGREVMFVPSEHVYGSIHDAVKAYDGVLTEMARRGHSSVRAVGEIDYLRMARRRATDALAYEPIAHSVFADAPLHVICPYDARVLEPSLVEHARRTHPLLAGPGGGLSNEAFVDPAMMLAELWHGAGLVPESGDTLIQISGGVGSARQIRHAIATLVGGLGAGLDDAMLAIGEVLANAALHGTGEIVGSVWTSGDLVHCRVENTGPQIEDVCAGFRPPSEPEQGGMGLWIARQIADDMHISRGAAGPAITLTFRLPRPR